jgi:hypothetical protein
VKEVRHIHQEYTGKVYYLNEENRNKIANETMISYSEDGKFALVYTQKDVESLFEVIDFVKFIFYRDEQSMEDEIYDNFLKEFDVEDILPNRFFRWGRTLKLIDDNTSEVKSFMIEHNKWDCLFNKHDSINGGSNLVYGDDIRNAKLGIKPDLHHYFMEYAIGHETIEMGDDNNGI